MNDRRGTVAIVDYEMGNLYSVQQACYRVRLVSRITADPEDVLASDAVILPGIGAMPDALRALRKTGMDEALRTVADSGRPLFGICLGMQLLMNEGTEFGQHRGLGIVPGTVVRFQDPMQDGRRLKVPAIGWNAVWPADGPGPGDPWRGTPLFGTPPGEPFYFVHSYCVVPADTATVLATTRYGSVTYCSAIGTGNVFGCQFHPERSGPGGLRMYEQFARAVWAPGSRA